LSGRYLILWQLQRVIICRISESPQLLRSVICQLLELDIAGTLIQLNELTDHECATQSTQAKSRADGTLAHHWLRFDKVQGRGSQDRQAPTRFATVIADAGSLGTFGDGWRLSKIWLKQ
jgi:hypothetical protein